MHQILIVSSGTTFVVGLDLSWPPQVGIRFENVSFAYQSRQDKKARPDAKLYIENVHVCLPMQTVQTCSHTYPGPTSGTYFFRLREMLTKKTLKLQKTCVRLKNCSTCKKCSECSEDVQTSLVTPQTSSPLCRGQKCSLRYSQMLTGLK